jgi:hypothetical protein
MSVSYLTAAIIIKNQTYHIIKADIKQKFHQSFILSTLLISQSFPEISRIYVTTLQRISSLNDCFNTFW